MANLIDTIIKGTARVLGTVFAKKVQTDTLNAPTTSGGSTFGPGTNGQILKSNGTTMYWGEPDKATSASSADSVPWTGVTGKPSTFAPTIGKTATTAAAGNHTHTTSIATGGTSDTSSITLAHGAKYKLTAGETTYVFTMPAATTNADTVDNKHASDFATATQGTNSDNHIANTSNPHSVTKSQVGLGNVTNDAQVKRTEMGVASGVATLDTNGKVPTSQLPSYVDDVLEYASKTAFPTTGETGKIYVATDTNLTYRWGGSAYVEISPSLAIGTTSSTAAAGNHNHDSVYQPKGNYKTIQTAVSDPTASTTVTSVSFIDTISQNTNGVITPTKKTVSSASTSAAGLMSAADKTKLDGIASGAQANQNAFSNVKVGTTTIAADSTTDTLELVAGTNITLTPDATNDKVTITASITNNALTTTSVSGTVTGSASGTAGIAGTVGAPSVTITKTTVTDALGYTPPMVNTEYTSFVGATESRAGAGGLVPAPAAGKHESFLRGDGIWTIPLSIGTTSTTAAAGNHTHTTSLATGGTSDTSTITLSHGGKYKLTAGGTNVVFTMPADSDTKNTAGSTNTSSKIFLIGATSQAANPQTYSHDTAYVGTDGCLYSGGNKVLTSYETHATYDTSTASATDLNYVLGTYTA